MTEGVVLGGDLRRAFLPAFCSSANFFLRELEQCRLKGDGWARMSCLWCELTWLTSYSFRHFFFFYPQPYQMHVDFIFINEKTETHRHLCDILKLWFLSDCSGVPIWVWICIHIALLLHYKWLWECRMKAKTKHTTVTTNPYWKILKST